MKGVVIPNAPGEGLAPWYDERYDPIWAACQDFELPVHIHAGGATRAGHATACARRSASPSAVSTTASHTSRTTTARAACSCLAAPGRSPRVAVERVEIFDGLRRDTDDLGQGAEVV